MKKLYLEEQYNSNLFSGKCPWLNLRRATLHNCTREVLLSLQIASPQLREIVLQGRYMTKKEVTVSELWMDCPKKLQLLDVSELKVKEVRISKRREQALQIVLDSS